jgi:acetyl esterase/lipase
MNHKPRSAALVLLLAATSLAAQQPAPQPTTAAEAPKSDTSYIDAHGTAHITRVVPVPDTISPEAQQVLARSMPDQGPPESLADRRIRTDARTAIERVAWTAICPNQLVEDKIAGVPVRIVTPAGMPDTNRDKVLLNLHGGGFDSDSGSYTETTPSPATPKSKS